MYTQEDILEFQMKDKRIMFQSIFSSLCNYYKSTDDTDNNLEDMITKAFVIVEKLTTKYPMKTIDQTVVNRSQGQPF